MLVQPGLCQTVGNNIVGFLMTRIMYSHSNEISNTHKIFTLLKTFSCLTQLSMNYSNIKTQRIYQTLNMKSMLNRVEHEKFSTFLVALLQSG